VLNTDSRRMAQDESERQNQLLQHEIDAHRRTDAALQAAKDHAESASEAKTRYVAGMTHELRSPLNSILGYTQILLKSHQVEGWVRETLATMQHSGQHMHALIDGSLELAQIEAGRLRLETTAVPLPELLADVERMMRPQAEAKGLRFTVEVLGTMPAWIRADARRLRQILINLLANAVRFTVEGEIRLRLNFRRNVSRLDVIDTGIGIAPQDQARIFLPFERGSAGRRASETGTGLGLTITHLLTDLMGGELVLASTPGRGSTFSVRIYLPEVAGDHQGQRAPAPALHPVIGYLAPRRTLLVVDDQALQRQLLAALLMPLGFTVLEAASGRECVEIVEQQRVDAVLLDITMDDLDGWQTAALLRTLQPASALPIMFVSGNLFDHRPDRIEALQCQGFVAKPVLESQLLDALERALQLEWVRADTPLAPLHATRPSTTDAAMRALPETLRQELRRLARQANASALRHQLREARAGLPEHAEALAALQGCADRFDFTEIAERLREDDDVVRA
jgi:CheY-like chemotaxis protein/nitrogen-specific signal transduction histidine kinase